MTPTYVELTDEQKRRIRAALGESLPAGVHADFADDEVMEHRGEYRLMVQPREYPEAMYDFIAGLAKAEVRLRGEGLKVRLDPDVRQRMLVVASSPMIGEVAYTTTDGAEMEDLLRECNLRMKELDGVSYDTYAYDSPEDLRYALDEARAEHPDADYHRVE